MTPENRVEFPCRGGKPGTGCEIGKMSPSFPPSNSHQNLFGMISGGIPDYQFFSDPQRHRIYMESKATQQATQEQVAKAEWYDKFIGPIAEFDHGILDLIESYLSRYCEEIERCPKLPKQT